MSFDYTIPEVDMHYSQVLEAVEFIPSMFTANLCLNELPECSCITFNETQEDLHEV